MNRYQHIGKKFAVALGFACAACSSQAIASTIVAPVTSDASSEFPVSPDFDGSIENTINQSGLSSGYDSGVTDFDTYLASEPEHTSDANGNEWFSENFGANSVAGLTVTYGFSALTSINGFALWNEDFAGLGNTLLQYSVNGSAYTDLMTILPVPSEFAQPGEEVPYLAQVFSFSLTEMLFFRLVIADCPGPPPSESIFRGCGIGEVAFSAELSPVDNNPVVPLPAALPLFGSALGFFVWMGRRRKRYN